jgi:hypothetical protein
MKKLSSDQNLRSIYIFGLKSRQYSFGENQHKELLFKSIDRNQENYPINYKLLYLSPHPNDAGF